jgi:hypothetical protein
VYQFAANSNTDYRADFNQTVAGITYGNLVLSASSNGTIPGLTIKTAESSITAQGNVNIGRGQPSDINVALNMADNNADLTLAGNLSLPSGAPQISWSNTGTLQHNGGNWNIDPDIKYLNNVVLVGTGTKTLQAPLSITGDFLASNGITFNMATHTLTGTVGHTFSLGNNTSLNVAIPSTTGVAFPTGFGAYNLNGNSTVNLN